MSTWDLTFDHIGSARVRAGVGYLDLSAAEGHWVLEIALPAEEAAHPAAGSSPPMPALAARLGEFRSPAQAWFSCGPRLPPHDGRHHHPPLPAAQTVSMRPPCKSSAPPLAAAGGGDGVDFLSVMLPYLRPMGRKYRTLVAGRPPHDRAARTRIFSSLELRRGFSNPATAHHCFLLLFPLLL